MRAFVAAYGTMGYELCESGDAEVGFQKIAIFVDSSDSPTHAARQLASGTWTSKLGKWEDIVHDQVDEVALISGCEIYGRVACFLRRPTDEIEAANSGS